MYNINSTTTYSEDRRSLYLAVGFASLSLISYSETSNSVLQISEPRQMVQHEEVVDQDSSELTQHAMNLSAASLAEDWDDESDEHWESFL